MRRVAWITSDGIHKRIKQIPLMRVNPSLTYLDANHLQV